MLRVYGQINGEFEDWLLVMSDKPVDKNDPVRVVSLTNESNRVKICARVAARKNPEYSYKYEDKMALTRQILCQNYGRADVGTGT